MAKRRTKTSKGQGTLWGRLSAPAPQPEPFVHGAWLGRKVHLMGVGGIGMSGIAQVLRSEGCIVTGCDSKASEITAALPAAGIPVEVGHSPLHIEAETEVVVYSAAIRKTNPELREAQRRGLVAMKYAEFLGRLLADRESVAVSGAHGKTTTSSMIAFTMNEAGCAPGMVIGGLVPQLGGNACSGGHGPFVVEACEYDRSFHNLAPKAAVITNIDRTHPDCYPGMAETVEAFGEFASLVKTGGVVVVNGDDPHALTAAKRVSAGVAVETFGEGRDCTWRMAEFERRDRRSRFTVVYKNRTQGRFELAACGRYNAMNALACLAVCRAFGVKREAVRKALAEFSGVRRRMDRLGEARGVLVLDDYGHHPTEARLTLDALRNDYPGRRLFCVFQPHQCSRTRVFLKEFAASFGAVDRVIVPDIYSVRDTAADRSSIHASDLVRQLRRNGVEAAYEQTFPRVVRRLLDELSEGDVVITMGAGPVDSVGKDLLTALRSEHTHDNSCRRTEPSELVVRLRRHPPARRAAGGLHDLPHRRTGRRDARAARRRRVRRGLGGGQGVGLPVSVLGLGSNLLVADQGVRGIVICTRKMMHCELENGGRTVRVEAGADLRRLVRWTARSGLQGLEHLAGIPGSVGGAVVMNAGTRGGSIGERVRAVWCVAADGALYKCDGERIGWGYRASDLTDPVARVELGLETDDADAVLERMTDAQIARQGAQPVGIPSAGCFFNPAGDDRSAGYLIEDVGLKGAAVGGAAVSSKHANFIVNRGEALAAEVFSLYRLVRDRVQLEHDVVLENEVRFWPTGVGWD